MRTNTLTVGLLAKERPAVIDDLNNGQGAFLYNHNITTVLVKEDEHGGIEITTDKKESTGTMLQYDSLRVEYPKTADNIFHTLLAAKYPDDAEIKLLNDYQSAELGFLPKDAKLPYKEFLKDRLAIRAMVEEDCKQNNIPIDL